MERVVVRAPLAADAGAVSELVAAVESSMYGTSAFSRADPEEEWSELDLEQNARVVGDGERIVGYGAVQEQGGIAYAEGYVHPDALGRGVGIMLATELEEDAARLGAHAIRNSVLEADSAGRGLLESLGYVAVRIFREMRITLDTPAPAPRWPDGLRVVPFDPAHDAHDFHAAHQEAFAAHWGHHATRLRDMVQEPPR